MNAQLSSQTKIGSILAERDNDILLNALLILGGLVFLSLFAQISLPLPWTPVPVTGQTFAASLIGLTLGMKRGVSVFALYLMLGALGAPLFFGGSSGLFGLTSGYLLGMFFSVSLIGYFADRGKCKTFLGSLLVCYLGSFFVFGFGLLVLSAFVPSDKLFTVGLFPFLLGDLIKNTIASGISKASYKL